MKGEVYIVLISTKYINARKECENMERITFVSPLEHDRNGEAFIVDTLIRHNSDLDGYLSVFDISYFMDLVNSQDIDMEKYFMSYVYYQKRLNTRK